MICLKPSKNLFITTILLGFCFFSIPHTAWAAENLYQGGDTPVPGLAYCNSAPNQYCYQTCPINTKSVPTAGCVVKGQICCNTANGSDCAGSCVPEAYCEGGQGKNKKGDGPGVCPSGEMCCAQGVVTPEGSKAGCAPQGGSCIKAKDCTGEGKVIKPMEECATQSAKGASGGEIVVCCIGGGKTTPGYQVVSQEGRQCQVPGAGVSFPCPIGPGTKSNIIEAVGSMLRFVLGFAGALFFAMFIYGGVLFIVAGDSSDMAGKAQKALVNAVIGVVIVIFSYVFLDMFFGLMGS